MSNFSTVEQIPVILTDIKRADWLEASRNGKSGRFQAGTLADYILAQRVPEQTTGAFWKTVPVYTVSQPLDNPVVNIQAGGVVQKSASTINPGAQTLNLPNVVGSGNGRFDAVVFDLTTNVFKAITGGESATPSQPSYNVANELLLTYVLINESGPVEVSQPNSHEQDKDLYLAKGTANQVSAAEIRAFLDAGNVDRAVATFADLATLPDKKNGENVYVADASADATVEAGWAIYKYVLSGNTFVKIAEQESIDLVIVTRDKGHFADLAALQAAYPAPAEGSLATVAEGKHIYVFEGGQYIPYGGSGTGPAKEEIIIPVYSDVDTVNYMEICLKGNNINFIDFYFASKLSAATVYIALDIPSPTFEAQTTKEGLNAWKDANVPDTDTKFLIYASGNFVSGQSGSATITLVYTL